MRKPHWVYWFSLSHAHARPHAHACVRTCARVHAGEIQKNFLCAEVVGKQMQFAYYLPD